MQFKGISACPGKASGLVCIINHTDQFAHCTEENIVLLNQVKPNAALAKKVKAILAVHGGVTSHAAIVARENNKPAIVGLSEEILWKIKNGDMVEVDAEKGIVRKID
ncbi:hypothetical protein EPN28_03295 [Patescibacteria group bacterium]|nr:MAG: hypothetical protein EPN28_03295 [Patescibacteria group bacterium]